jgi:uncharacterized protein (TIGR03118 family)
MGKLTYDVGAPGAGFVDIFSTEGVFIKRLITGGELNSPWGLARVTEEHFGKFNDETLLVGNFGDGHINAYNVFTGTFLGTLERRAGQPLQFNGLWSLFFFEHKLYFTVGIVDESHGLFGSSTCKSTSTPTIDRRFSSPSPLPRYRP